jgi:hypothetical protein
MTTQTQLSRPPLSNLYVGSPNNDTIGSKGQSLSVLYRISDNQKVNDIIIPLGLRRNRAERLGYDPQMLKDRNSKWFWSGVGAFSIAVSAIIGTAIIKPEDSEAIMSWTGVIGSAAVTVATALCQVGKLAAFEFNRETLIKRRTRRPCADSIVLDEQLRELINAVPDYIAVDKHETVPLPA